MLRASVETSMPRSFSLLLLYAMTCDATGRVASRSRKRTPKLVGEGRCSGAEPRSLRLDVRCRWSRRFTLSTLHSATKTCPAAPLSVVILSMLASPKELPKGGQHWPWTACVNNIGSRSAKICYPDIVHLAINC